MAGDHDFEDWFRRLLPEAVRLARRVLLTDAEAEDAAAEAFARALARWRRVQSLPYRDAWVLRTVTNVAIDVTRRRRSLPAAPEATVDPADATVVRLALAAALDRLPRRQREVVSLRYLAEWPSEQVAESLGLSLHTVKKHNDRGMAALRAMVGATREGFNAI
jgi:RNA polymerase sigma factor (sigma-70 family)